MTKNDDAKSPAGDGDSRSKDQSPGGADRNVQVGSPQGESAASTPMPSTQERTPEFVEEEALRGDFVLRWAIVLLAFELAFTQIDDTRTLLHVRAGEYMQSHGFLPPRVDVFSYTADGESWMQFSWVLDHIIAVAHALSGAAALTVLKALFAAVAFGIAVHTAIPRVSTWWTVVCCAFALVACHPRFTMTPEVVTLGCLALTIAWLYRWQTDENARFPWKLPVLFLVWSNLDPSMWIGIVAVILYGLGHAVDRLLGRNGWTLPQRSVQLGMVIGACLLASLINPFLWKPLLTQPGRAYSSELTAQRLYHPVRPSVAADAQESSLQYYGLFDEQFWIRRHHSGVAGAAILVIAILLFVFNWRNLDTGYLLMLLGFVLLAGLTSHELAAAALVAAILAGLNGQDWYRQNFRMEYTAETKEMVFSQGGRAVTVLALFGLAFLGVSGRLTGPEGTRLGVGLDPNLAATISTMEESLEEIDPEKSIFNFTPEQGDLLIWLGRRSFIDSRLGLFASTGTPQSIVVQHDNTRRAFRRRREGVAGTEDSALWQRTLADYDITYVMPRMYGPNPDYATFFDLLLSGEWKMDRLGASSAIFHRPVGGELGGTADFEGPGLRPEKETPLSRTSWAQPPSFYDRFLFVKKRVRRPPLRLAMHYSRLVQLQSLAETRPSQAIGLAYLTIRNANQSLIDQPNSADAYRFLGDAYGVLAGVEGRFARELGGLSTAELRTRLATAAMTQSLIADPDQPQVLLALYGIYQQQRPELAVDTLSRWLELVDTGEELSEEEDQRLESAYELRNARREEILGLIQQMEERRKQIPVPEDPAEAALHLVAYAQALSTEGLIVHALKVLEEDLDLVRGLPEGQTLYGSLLIEAGRIEEGALMLGQLAELARQQPDVVAGIDWQFPAAVSAMISGDYPAARGIWGDQLSQLEKAVVPDDRRLMLMPLVGPPAFWPVLHAQEVAQELVTRPQQQAQIRFYMALTLIEEGRLQSGADLMRQIVTSMPDAAVSPLASYYHSLIKPDEPLDASWDAGWGPADLDALDEVTEDQGTGDGEKTGGDANESDPAAGAAGGGGAKSDDQ